VRITREREREREREKEGEREREGEKGRERERNLIPLLNAAYTVGAVVGCNFEPLPFIRHHNVCLAVRSYYQNNRQIETTEIECTNAAVAAPAAAVAVAV